MCCQLPCCYLLHLPFSFVIVPQSMNAKSAQVLPPTFGRLIITTLLHTLLRLCNVGGAVKQRGSYQSATCEGELLSPRAICVLGNNTKAGGGCNK